MDPAIIRMELSVELLVPDEANPNEMSEREFNVLKETIREVGFIDPVTVAPLQDGKYSIVGGEHRWRAAKDLGMESVPADVLQGESWNSEEMRRFQNVRLNVIHGKMNPEKFLNLYNEMVGKHGREAVTRLMGFTSEDGIKKIVKSVARQMKESLPAEMTKEFEEKAKKARSVEDLEKIIGHLFEQHGDSLKYNFMVFAWGGKEHVYIAMSQKTHESLKKIMDFSRKNSVDINDIVADAIEAAAQLLEPGNDAN